MLGLYKICTYSPHINISVPFYFAHIPTDPIFPKTKTPDNKKNFLLLLLRLLHRIFKYNLSFLLSQAKKILTWTLQKEFVARKERKRGNC